jgi:hypothetical protein
VSLRFFQWAHVHPPPLPITTTAPPYIKKVRQWVTKCNQSGAILLQVVS